MSEVPKLVAGSSPPASPTTNTLGFLNPPLDNLQLVSMLEWSSKNHPEDLVLLILCSSLVETPEVELGGSYLKAMVGTDFLTLFNAFRPVSNY